MNKAPETYTEFIEEYLLDDALDCGISVSDFYDMTIKEITKVRDSFLRKREIRRKDTADMVYRLSTLITNGTACIISKDNQPIQFLDIFADIFEEESKDNEENKINAQIEINKQHMKEFAQRINSQKYQIGGENK
ncbi:MAG: hypothetical protein RR891_06030 [Clostridium sp.]